MKKLVLFLAGLFTFTAMHAQWVDGPSTNTLIANCSDDAGEVYLSTNEETGDTYVQWMQFGPNNWSPTLQRLNAEGVPQWGMDGIHLGYHQFSSSAEGVAMVATTDGGVVSCFSVYDGYSYAVKLNADGSYAWGEEGVQLFDGLGFSRTEVIAGEDGGVWTLGFDYSRLFAQYVSADGTLNPNIIISDPSHSCMFGQLTLGKDNKVFVTYEKTNGGMYTNKEIVVAGYDVDGTQVSPETVLMSESETFQSTYIHYAISDGLGGGYVYIWHPGNGNAFNLYVFHFDQYGVSTIQSQQGVAVHTPDPDHYYGEGYATVDPATQDIILAYEKTDAYTQSESSVWINRITPDGEVLWGDGILVLDNGNVPCHDIRVDAYPNGDGFMVAYLRQNSDWETDSFIEAKGFDANGNLQWETVMNNVNDWKVAAENTTGFHNGQNIMMWVNHNDGGLYGQNIGIDGAMGYIEPVQPCLAPENFQGTYVYNGEDQTFGALLTWDAPETQPLWYQLYITLPDETIIVAEVEPTETEYFHELPTAATITYRLIAVYEYCESDYALTPDGEDYVSINVTGIEENLDDEIVTIMKIFNANGQSLQVKDLNELNTGLYILQGLTKDGRTVNRKVVVNK